MTDEIEEKIQDVVNLAAVGEVNVDDAEAELEAGLEKLRTLRKMRGET